MGASCRNFGGWNGVVRRRPESSDGRAQEYRCVSGCAKHREIRCAKIHGAVNVEVTGRQGHRLSSGHQVECGPERSIAVSQRDRGDRGIGFAPRRAIVLCRDDARCRSGPRVPGPCFRRKVPSPLARSTETVLPDLNGDGKLDVAVFS
jgi:hypothetical protein